jgi:hypothetical protein
MKTHFQKTSNTAVPDSNRIIEILIAVTVIAGVILSLTQFLVNRSLWWDEAALALNIIHKNNFELLQPLDYAQVAPILFLQIEKLFSIILPDSEYGLRLFPLLCYWASIYFLYQILRKQLNNLYVILIVLSLFVFNYLFLYYSSEVKQYMSDVFTMMCMFYFVQKDYTKERNKYYILAFAGIIAISLSNVAPIILFTCGIYLAYDYFYITHRRNLFPIASVFATWLGVFLLYYVLFIYEHPTRDFMEQYWTNLRAFLPSNPLSTDFYSFLIECLSEMCTTLYEFDIYVVRLIWKIFFGLFVMAGIVVLVKKKKIGVLIFVFTPLLLHLLLSAFHLYPFFKRLILYAMPGMIILFAYGFYEIITFTTSMLMLKTEKIISFATIACMLFLIGLFVIRGFPFKRFEGRNVIKFVQENIQNTENLYMAFHNIHVLKYYTDIGIISNNMNILNDMQHELTNECAESWMLKYNNARKQILLELLDKMKTLHGKNWIMPGPESISINEHLDSLGYKKLREFKSAETSVYLYDFGEGE